MKIIKKLLITSLLVFSIFSCAAKEDTHQEVKEMPSGEYIPDLSHTSVIFRVSHMGLSKYTARFTDVDAKLNFDPQDPTKSTLVATIKPDSIKTEYPFPKKENFDKFLSENENWFNSKKFPEIKFESTNIKKIGNSKATVDGNLTMFGVTKPMQLEVTYNGSYKSKPHSGKPALGFSAVGKIKRSDWGFGAFVPMLGDEVEIIIETELEKNESTTAKK